MSGYSNAVKDYVERYKQEVGSDGLLDAHAVAEWAYANGLHKPSVKTVIDAIATDIAQVFREEYRVDRFGRRYRAKHAATQKRGNKTLSLWADLDDPNAPHTHFVKSFAQRRQLIRMSAPPMVGVPALEKCDCGPSVRIGWPPLLSEAR